ncbi:MAG: transcription elongation factor GreA [Gammaproteobacteria bacterium]
MTDKVPMTKQGAEMLKRELETLKKQERPAIINAISEARAHGDLKENAEYHAAKEKQSFIEGRILDIEAKLSRAHVIDVVNLSKSDRVVFGVTVHLVNLDTDEAVKYQIVGEDEADLKHSKISVTSPIARALIGKNVGDEVEVQTPKGVVPYEVSKVEYV